MSAFALVMRGVGREIVLVDRNPERAQAEADDIHHAVPFSNPLDIRAGEYRDLAGSRVVIIAAGVAQKEGESRLDLLRRNGEVLGEVVPAILEHAPDSVLVMVSNPVDVLTHVAAHHAARRGIPAGRVIGSGTLLDTARFRALLGRRFGMDPQHVHGYVVGEHGDSEVLTWSETRIGGVRLEDVEKLGGQALTAEERDDLDRRVRGAAYRIIAAKVAAKIQFDTPGVPAYIGGLAR